jgi:hypothetical protein
MACAALKPIGKNIKWQWVKLLRFALYAAQIDGRLVIHNFIHTLA